MELNTGKKRYNTETASKLVLRETLRLPWKDSETYFEADLYRSRGGEYFLCGKGGILSLFKGQKEEKILPLTCDEAKAIAREFMRPQAYQEEFLGINAKSRTQRPILQ